MVRTDRGTENTLMAAMQCFLRRSHSDDHASLKAHAYGPSTSNQRIEAWWSHLRKSWTTWWMNICSQMVEWVEFDTSDDLQKNCLWFCFNKLVQQGLDQVCTNWDTHYIKNPVTTRKLEMLEHAIARFLQSMRILYRHACKHTFTTNHKTTMI